jgi:hypothetical protein
LPVSAVTEPGDHRTALVQALTEGAARAFAAGDTGAALLALDTVRTLVGDAAPGAPLVDTERKKRGASSSSAFARSRTDAMRSSPSGGSAPVAIDAALSSAWAW